MTGFKFGSDVIVVAETVRVLGKREPSGAAILRHVGAGDRYVAHNFREATAWPGTGISLELEPSPTTRTPFVLEPELSEVPYQRLRRVVYERPELGIVVGSTYRAEGTIVPGYESGPGEMEPAYLGAPKRKVRLLEVALQVAPTAKARFVLAHPSDLTLVRERLSA